MQLYYVIIVLLISNTIKYSSYIIVIYIGMSMHSKYPMLNS